MNPTLIPGDMGCGSSKRGAEKELYLPGSNLRFSQRQLAALNAHFSEIIDSGSDSFREPSHEKVMVTIERLIQRLVCGVGTLDQRFATKFLISLEPHRLRTKPGNSLSYLIRLDCLSEPALYPESGGLVSHLVECEGCPQGFSRIRVTGTGLENWAEFLSNQGFLRRDKIQEKFVELLAQSAARTGFMDKPGDIDESRLCASPGKVLDPHTLHLLVHVPPEQQVFYGNAECYKAKFPEPRDFRIAIVEGCSCIRLRVGLSSCGDDGVETDVEVTLVLGIGFTSWPNSAQFPARINLCHIDSLLYYEAATTGFYVVPAPPHPTLRCDDRSTLWQIRFPAAEMSLLKHYSNNSVPCRVLTALRSVLYDIRTTTNGGHVISDYMIKTLLWSRLEEEDVSVVRTMRNWTHDTLANHILVLLDRLIIALRTQRLDSYFFPWFNVMLNSPGGGTMHYTEEDYVHDAELVACYLRRLNDLSSPGTVRSVDTDCWRRMESSLVNRWTDVLADLTPPPATRSRRFSFAPLTSAGQSSIAASQYSLRQLDYIGQILRSILTVKSLTLSKKSSLPGWYHRGTNEINSINEDLVYLVSTLLEQAKYVSMVPLKDTSGYWIAKTTKKTTKSKFDAYDSSVNALLEEVRNDTATIDFTDDNAVVRQVLKWLYYGLDRHRKNMGHILRPYLSKLFTVSHENCWHMSEWRRRHDNDELAALCKCNSLIMEGKMSASDGIIDAYRKGWSWAESILEKCTDLPDGVELVYCPVLGRVVRHKLLGNKLDQDVPFGTRSLGRKHMTNSKHYASATLPRHIKPFKECLKSRLQRTRTDKEEFPSAIVHTRLRNTSPMTLTLENCHRYGNHRGLGSIVHALIHLRKFTVLQELSGMLPASERAQVLDEIQRVSREARRPPSRGDNPAQQQPNSKKSVKCGTVSGGSLVGTCRLTRRRCEEAVSPLYDASFFKGPSAEVVSPFYRSPNPSFFSPSLQDEMVHLKRSVRSNHRYTNNAVTKL